MQVQGNGKTSLAVGTYKVEGEHVAWTLALATCHGVRAVDTAVSYRNGKEVLKIVCAPWATDRWDCVTTKICKKLGEASVAQDVKTVKDEYPIYVAANPKIVYRVLFHHQVTTDVYIQTAREIGSACPSVLFGVSNYGIPALEQLLEALAPLADGARLKPVVNQIEFHPMVNCLPVVERCVELDVGVEAHSVLAKLKRLDHPIFATKEALAFGGGEAELMFRWVRSHKHLLDSVVVTSRNPAHWDRLIEWWNADPLPPAMLARMDEISRNRKEGQRLYAYRDVSYVRPKGDQGVLHQSPAVVGNSLAADYDLLIASVRDKSTDLSALGRYAAGFPSLSIVSKSGEWTKFVIEMARQSESWRKVVVSLSAQSKPQLCLDRRQFPETETAALVQSILTKTHNVVKELRKLIERARFHAKQAKKASNTCCLLHTRNSEPNPTGSPQIVNPEAMPVEVAPIEQLAPIFNLLSSGVTDSEEYRKVSFQEVDGVQAERGVMFEDGRLDMCKQVVGSEHIRALCEAVGTGAVPVRHFLLGNNVACADVEGAQSLADLVAKNLPIETFYLAGNRISARGLSLVADAMEALGDSSNVRAFWFKRNPIKPEGAVHAARIVAASRNVRVLDLDNCGLLDAGFESMVARLLTRNPPSVFDKPLQYGLRHLYLDANGISGDSLGWALFCVNLEVLPNLKTLYLSMNDLRDVGVRGLADNVRKLPNLRALCLSSNGITDEPIPNLVNKLGQLVNFKALDLGCYKSTRDLGCRPNTLTEKSLPVLAEWIGRNPKVQYLSLARNNITDLNALLDFLAGLRSNALPYGPVSVDAKQAAWSQNHRLVSHTKEERKRLLHTRRVDDIASIFRNKM